MINIITVKVGKYKYNHEDVNRVLFMVKRRISVPFKFFCITDDPQNIDPDVICIPIEDLDVSPIVYNKLYLFSENLPLDGACLYLDLDVILQKPIDKLIQHISHDVITTVKCYWRNKFIVHDHSPQMWADFNLWYFSTQQFHNINSSVMLWYHGEHHDIWNSFIARKEAMLTKYFLGMDSYLFFEHRDRLRFFPVGLVGSYLYGTDFNKQTMSVVRDTEKVDVLLMNGSHHKFVYEKLMKRIFD